MLTSQKVLTPPRIETQAFSDAGAAVDRLAQIYERNTAFMRSRFEAYANGEPLEQPVRATYPFVRITTGTYARLDSRLSFGFVAGPGVYDTTVTRPDLFRAYLIDQIGLLIENHGVPGGTCRVPSAIASFIAARSGTSKKSRSGRSGANVPRVAAPAATLMSRR